MLIFTFTITSMVLFYVYDIGSFYSKLHQGIFISLMLLLPILVLHFMEFDFST